MFQFLRLSNKFLAVLRLSVNPIETLLLIQIDQETLVQTGFKSEVTEKLVSLFTKAKKV